MAALDAPDHAAAAAGAEPGLARSTSGSRLNAKAPEFVPRATSSPTPPHTPSPPPAVAAVPVVHLFAQPPPPPPFFAQPPPPPPPVAYDMYGFVPDAELADVEPPPPVTTVPSSASASGSTGGGGAWEGLSDDVVQKVTKQVEYYFSDINLATTEHLMRCISKDSEGFVPITVIHGFKKIKTLLHNTSHLAVALRTSAKLVVSEDGKKVRRQQPFTEADLEALQSRIVVAENLPEDHCYQNLMKIFSAVGRVKTIRTCYPQTANGTAPVTNRSARLDMLFSNKLHAFVEYDTVEDAEKAIAELNDVRNWRGGLRVRLLNTCLVPGKQGSGRAKKGQEGDGYGEEEDVSTSNQPNEKQIEDMPQSFEQENGAWDENNEGYSGGARGRGRGGRGGRGRGRGYQYNNHHHPNNRGRGTHPIGTPPSSHIHTEHPAAVASKQPPGPRMPDGTRGFTMGRGKPVPVPVPAST